MTTQATSAGLQRLPQLKSNLKVIELSTTNTILLTKLNFARAISLYTF